MYIYEEVYLLCILRAILILHQSKTFALCHAGLVLVFKTHLCLHIRHLCLQIRAADTLLCVCVCVLLYVLQMKLRHL